MTGTILEIDQLHAGYDSAAVVRNLTLSVAPGEIVALLGANGAGKTTTLRAVSGIVRPMQGSVTIDGRDTRSVSASQIARMGVAHVPEGRGIFYGLTVAEHFKLGPKGEKLDPEAGYRYFPALSELANRTAGLLSGGEQQMLAVGRALVRRPRLLLLDERSLGPPPEIVERRLPVAREYATEEGCAVVLVEQHVGLALDVADRAYVLSHGHVALHRPAAELRGNHDLLLQSYLGEAAA
jgi:branched-chain amino acid transport system ATP-binding protein